MLSCSSRNDIPLSSCPISSPPSIKSTSIEPRSSLIRLICRATSELCRRNPPRSASHPIHSSIQHRTTHQLPNDTAPFVVKSLRAAEATAPRHRLKSRGSVPGKRWGR
ncbi:hypothetical protein Q9L58_003847 [Maublancomyces gigas]|uniref:Uncharacterized protein n=1 Tax=Discina gigas TaxID=1032678 RepID=A0ABR3GN76_9PEZI